MQWSWFYQKWFEMSVELHKISQSIYPCDFKSVFGQN